MAISDVPTYTIVNDFSAEELKLLEGKKSNLFFNNLIIKNEIRHIKKSMA
jgi:hypothetical protein